MLSMRPCISSHTYLWRMITDVFPAVRAFEGIAHPNVTTETGSSSRFESLGDRLAVVRTQADRVAVSVSSSTTRSLNHQNVLVRLNVHSRQPAAVASRSQRGSLLRSSRLLWKELSRLIKIPKPIPRPLHKHQLKGASVTRLHLHQAQAQLLG
jgi:hypothetical protein